MIDFVTYIAVALEHAHCPLVVRLDEVDHVGIGRVEGGVDHARVDGLLHFGLKLTDVPKVRAAGDKSPMGNLGLGLIACADIAEFLSKIRVFLPCVGTGRRKTLKARVYQAVCV